MPARPTNSIDPETARDLTRGTAPPPLLLQPTADATLPAIRGASGGRTAVGRLTTNDVSILLAGVSRRHATLLAMGGTWHVVDHGSTSGTFVNGVALSPETPCPLTPGDLVLFGPASYRVRDGEDGTTGGASTIGADGGATTTAARAADLDESAVDVAPARTSADERLTLLTELLERLASIQDERALCDAVVEAALAGTRFGRASVLRQSGDAEVGDGDHAAAEIVTWRERPRGDARIAADVTLVPTALGADPDGGSERRYSRSLVSRAFAGEAVVLKREETGWHPEHSISMLRIDAALAAPVQVGAVTDMCLYLDARADEPGVDAASIEFGTVLARAFGLALANLRRAALESRQRVLNTEMEAARSVQRVMLPAPRGHVGELDYAVRMRPGLYVAGDLFEVVDLGDGRAAIALGDVTGHGLGSALLMALVQSSLHAELRRGGPPAEAVSRTNEFLAARVEGGRFISLFLAVTTGEDALEVVDAGHGHALLRSPDGTLALPDTDRGIPLGIDADHPYRSRRLDFPAGSRLVVYSDGIIEQRSGHADGDFGGARLAEALAESTDPAGDVSRVMDALDSFRGSAAMIDDATIASFARRPIDD